MTEIYSEKLDHTDMELLRLLQIDSKMKISDLAKEVGKGIATVHARMKQLKKKGIIERYAAILEPEKVGRETLAFILVTVRYRVPGRKGVVSQREFCKEIAVHPLIQGVYVVSGDYDVLLKVRARNIDEMNRFSRFDTDVSPEHRKKIMRFYKKCVQRHLYVFGPEKHFLSKNPRWAWL